jgi:hypothetical protein
MHTTFRFRNRNEVTVWGTYRGFQYLCRACTVHKETERERLWRCTAGQTKSHVILVYVKIDFLLSEF